MGIGGYLGEDHHRKFFLMVLVLLVIMVIVYISVSMLDQESGLQTEPLPRDFPVHPQAQEVYGYTSGAITHYTYTVPLDATSVKNYYDTQIDSIWLVEKDWFEQGDGEQKHFKTSDYNPKPGEKAGRSVQVVVSSNGAQSTTKLVIVATINS